MNAQLKGPEKNSFRLNHTVIAVAASTNQRTRSARKQKKNQRRHCRRSGIWNIW